MPEFIIHNRSRLLPEVIDYRDRLTLDINYTEEPKLSLPGSLKIDPWGHWHWPLVISTPERAILEVIDDIPNRISFDMVETKWSAGARRRPRTGR